MIEARRWSDPLSSIFQVVVWQKGKARIVMDHTASALNDRGIRVCYDVMRSFGQVLFNARRALPDRALVSSAFLNLPGWSLASNPSFGFW
jgi:hypothetical protein